MQGFDLSYWVLVVPLLILAVPTLLPIITGLVCTRRTSWVSPRFGFLAGLGAAVTGSAVLGGATFGIASIMGGSIPPPWFWSGLATTVIIQNALVVGLCLFVNNRRDRSWGIRRW